MCWVGTGKVVCARSVIRLEAAAGSGLRFGPEGIGGWRCIAVDKLSQVQLQTDAWRGEPRLSQQRCVQEVDFDGDAQPGTSPQKGQ